MTAIEEKREWVLTNLVGVQDESLLQQFIYQLQKYYGQNGQIEKDWWDDMTPNQQRLISEAREMAKDPKNWIDNDEVMKEMDSWPLN